MQLSEGEVHLWALPLDEAPLQQAEPPTLDLAVDERARAARMRCPQARSVFVQTRMALRALLGHYLDLPAGAVALSSGAWGKPQLGAGMGDLQFNVSHSGQLALIALSLSAVGVDLEWQQADLDWRELLPLCCHPAEQADFQDAADAQGRARLLRLWTAKEAYLKGRGEGLSLPLTAIRLSAGGGWQARIEAPWDAGQGWWLHALALPAGYLGCVATPFPSPLIRFQSLAELTSSARVESPHYPEVLSPLRESTMECIQSLPSSSAAFTLEHFRQQGPRELNANPYLQRQAARESNARSYPRRIPLALQEAHGMYVRDTQGQLFMDCLAGAGTLALGHNHPVAIAAMRQTLDAGLPLHTLDLTTPVKDRFVEELFAALPEAFARQARIQFCGPTGADGIEAALKLARIATGRKPILSFSGGYHGMTHGALSLMGNLGPKLALGAAMAEVQFLPYPYDYRCPFGIGGEAGIDAGLHYIEQLLSDPESGVLPPAAVVVEVVQGEGGVIPAPARWLQGLRQLTRKHGIVLIIDEVQTGLGRTGRLFAFEHADIEPDILVLSKALGGGLPLSVLVYRDELDTWKPGAHAGTFRGNQMAMAAGAATLRHILSENLPAHAATMGERLMGRLRQLQHDYPCLGDVRGRGLMVGVEIVGAADGSRVPPADSALAKAIQHQCLCLGIILELGGRHGAVVRFLPPLLIQPEEIDLLVERFQQALDQALAKVTSRALHIA